MNSDLVEMVEYSFGSVWALELLLVLRRDRARGWHPNELVQELRSSDVVVSESIDRLVAVGLAVIEDGNRVRYSPSSAEHDALVGLLEDEYRKKPAAIRRLIIKSPAEKLKSFADAFKLKQEE